MLIFSVGDINTPNTPEMDLNLANCKTHLLKTLSTAIDGNDWENLVVIRGLKQLRVWILSHHFIFVI